MKREKEARLPDGGGKSADGLAGSILGLTRGEGGGLKLELELEFETNIVRH